MCDLYNSDHFPIITTIDMNNQYPTFKPSPKYNLVKANWTSFQDKSFHANPNKVNSTITKTIRKATNISIIQKLSSRTYYVPLWSRDLTQWRNETLKISN